MTKPRFLTALFALLLLIACSSRDSGTTPPLTGDNLPRINFAAIQGRSLAGQTTVLVPGRSVQITLNPTVPPRSGTRIEAVELTIDGRVLRDTASPWEFTVDFPRGGSVQLTAVAIDNLGRRSAPATITVIVDLTPPVITEVLVEGQNKLINTDEVAAVAGSIVPVFVRAIDEITGSPDLGTSLVTIRVNFRGVVIAQAQGGELSFDIDTSEVPPGRYPVTITATDAVGNQAAPVNFVLRVVEPTTEDTSPPIVEILSPAEGAGFAPGAEILVRVSARDPESGIRSGSLLVTLNGAELERLDTSTFRGVVPATEGAFVVTAQATNAAANPLTTSESRTFVVDATPPTLSLIVEPGSGERLPQTIRGNATDAGAGVDRVVVTVTNAAGETVFTANVTPRDIGGGEGAPGEQGVWSVTWDPAGEPFGTYTVRAIAIDRLGNSTADNNTSQSRQIIFTDRTEPTVVLTSPVAGVPVSGSVRVRANVTDNDAIASVEFYANGTLIGIDREGRDGFEVLLDTTTLPNAPLILYALATDLAGNSSTSPLVTVTVANRPGVFITSPMNGEVRSGIISVSVDAQDAVGITNVTLLVNGTPTATLTSAPYVFALDTTQYPNGELRIRARATNTAGLTQDSDLVTIQINNIVGPVFSIASPANGSALGGFAGVSISVGVRNSPYVFTSDIVVDVLDYRGQVADTATIPVQGLSQDGIYNTRLFDFAALPDDVYTIRARATVLLEGGTPQAREQVLETAVQIFTETASNLPPALVMYMPARLDAFDPSKDPLVNVPEVGSEFFVVAEVTDDSGAVHAVELRLVCDGSLPTTEDDACRTNPVDALIGYAAGPYGTVVMSASTVGTPFVPDGLYYLRLVAVDSANLSLRNLQEIVVRVNRNDPVAQDNRNRLRAGPASVDPLLVIVPGSATWQLSLASVPATERVRYVFIVARDGVVAQVVLGLAQGGETVSYSRGFGDQDIGFWTVTAVLQNLENGAFVARSLGGVTVAAP